MTNLLATLLRPERWSFSLAYRRGRMPWDSGIVPPELREVIEGAPAPSPGYALDIGCGTGTNSLYLAQHGWQVVGVDFAGPAIQRANEKLKEAGLLTGSARFLCRDASNPQTFDLGHTCSLFFDLGCLHTIPRERRTGYASGLIRHASPGALYLLYGFAPHLIRRRLIGITVDEVRDLFTPAFKIERIAVGNDTTRGAVSTWYWLRHQADTA